MSKEDLAALAAAAEERQTAYLRKWLAMPEVREFLNESARQMRETVRAEIRAEFEGRRDAAPAVATRDAFMADDGLVWLEGPDWERVKRAYHTLDREALNEAARKFVEANPNLPRVA